MNHLPVNRGFDHHMGFLTGAQDFYSADRWEGEAPFPNTRGHCTPGGVAGCACVPNSPGCTNLSRTEAYASNICGDRAVASLRAHDPSTPYFLYLPWQAVHHPHEAPPDWPDQSNDIGSYRGTWVGLSYAAAGEKLLPAHCTLGALALVACAGLIEQECCGGRIALLAS